MSVTSDVTRHTVIKDYLIIVINYLREIDFFISPVPGSLLTRLLSPLTDIILLEADHQAQFSCSGLSSRFFVRWNKKRVKWNEFGEFDEAGNPKTLLAKNSVEFIDFAEPQRPHRRPFLKLLGRLSFYCDKVCGQTNIWWDYTVFSSVKIFSIGFSGIRGSWCWRYSNKNKGICWEWSKGVLPICCSELFTSSSHWYGLCNTGWVIIFFLNAQNFC